MSQPWPELKEFALSFDLATLDDITHHHLPYGTRVCLSVCLRISLYLLQLCHAPAAIILIQAAERWKAQQGSLPSTSKDRATFKELITNMQRSINGVPVEVSFVLDLWNNLVDNLVLFSILPRTQVHYE